MANRMKEEEKNEKIIRGLLKLPANKRCINCNSLGPQYVCTNFRTFICTNCSGLHREFTHRVKSISMAKFTSQEVSALQEGGNERAREVYFKEWDPERHSYPDSSHLDRLRDFIKHVYVERRYAGGKNTDDLPRLKGEQADYDENRGSNTDRSGSRSPPYNDPYERRFSERPGSAGRSDDKNSRINNEGRSPSYDQGDYRSPSYDQGDYRSPSRFEMRDELRGADKDGNDAQSPKSYSNKIPNELPKPGVSDNKKGTYISSPPMVRPVREILGSDIPPLRVGELPKLNGGKAPNSSSEAQVSTSSKRHNDGNSIELKWVNSGSLIDFSADSEHPATAAAAAEQESFPQQTGSSPANSGGWASFDISGQKKAPEASSATGDLESVFAQLSVHASTTPVVNSTTSTAANTNSFLIGNNGQWPAVQQQLSSLPVSNQSTNPPLHELGSLNNQVSAQPVGPFPSAAHGSMAVIDGQSIRPAMHLSHMPAVFGSFQNSLEAKSSERKELPADLFTGLYSTLPTSYPGWRTGPHHGMVYRMQYPVMVEPMTYGAAQLPLAYRAAQQTTTFHNPIVSTNPFDLGNESTPGANSMINPPTASLQAAVRNPSNLSSLPNTTKLASVSSQWTPPQQLSYPSSASPGSYMMPQFPDNIPPHLSSNYFPAMNQGAGVGYGVSNSSQLPARANYSHGSNNPSLSSAGGNPFG